MLFIVVVLMLPSSVNAEIPDHHGHIGNTELTFNYEFLDFTNSKQKEDGRRYGVTVDHQDSVHHYQLYVEHTDTQTKPVIPKNLSVNKYAFKYQYAMGQGKQLSFVYTKIDDNLISEVDGGNIYGFGYKHKALSMMQYVSDYDHFNVYQTDVEVASKKDVFRCEGKRCACG